jgi:hypothetical protein
MELLNNRDGIGDGSCVVTTEAEGLTVVVHEESVVSANGTNHCITYLKHIKDIKLGIVLFEVRFLWKIVKGENIVEMRTHDCLEGLKIGLKSLRDFRTAEFLPFLTVVQCGGAAVAEKTRSVVEWPNATSVTGQTSQPIPA